MCDLICFSQYFVNKQNIRSFCNILNLKLLKRENSEEFFKQIFDGECPVQKIPLEIKAIIFNLQQNLNSCSKQDFKNYFVMSRNDKGSLFSVNKEIVLAGCWKALNDIIPKILIGDNHNNKIFRKCTKEIIFSMKFQYLQLKKFVHKWNYGIFPWKNISVEFSFQILNIILKWIFKYMLSAIISLTFYVTTCKVDNDENKLHYFWKNQWQRFYDSKISEMVSAKVIHKFELTCLGKKVKRKYSLLEKIKLKILKKEIPKLHLILKRNNEYRPIVQYKNEAQSLTDKYKAKERFFFLKKLVGKSQEKIDTQYMRLYTNWLAKGQPKLYFIKTDLTDAFGSINRTNLLKILSERYLNLQNIENSCNIKNKHAHHYKEMMDELAKPLLIRAGSTIFEWKKGLVQGYKYSPALSDLYYSHMDELYFSDHSKSHEVRLFIRVVDDYLYITESLDDAHLFLKALSNYKNVNYQKTVVNFEHETTGFSREIIFLGYSYNTETLNVSRANTAFTGQICYKIAFSAAIMNLELFLESRISQAGIQINNHIFNFYHNNEELIWKHIFLTLCLSASKFCTILAILCEENEMVKYLSLYKRIVTIKLCNKIIDTLEKNKSYDFVFLYCINHFRYLSFKAILLCARKTQKCNILVPHINGELMKSNCIYGKWKAHSRSINKLGQIKKEAIKNICRKTDLRLIFKNFDVLPYGVECYDHRKFYK